MRAVSAILSLSALLAMTAAAPTPRPIYAEGQIWAYTTRPKDQSSLLKINKVEGKTKSRAAPIYHISVVGVHLGDDAMIKTIAHLPVSQETLDSSVVELVTSSAEFPDSAEGVAQWRAAHGGVFSLPVSEIIEIADRSLRK